MLLDRGPSASGGGRTLRARARRPHAQPCQAHRQNVACPRPNAEDSTGLPRPCFFLEKAYQAQMAGADALLVANDHAGDLSTAVAPDDEDSTRCAQ